MPLRPEDFDRYFQELHGVEPFPWQRRVAHAACSGVWPSPIALPTAAGKTAAIDVAVFALACGTQNAARRIFFIVDRRIVVDEATERAIRIAERLRSARSEAGVVGEVARALLRLGGSEGAEPLHVARLRGGVLRDDSWLRSPLKPMVCCSTVDQVGSALLFRGYGARSPLNWPLQAALVTHDALFLVDEAHNSVAFLETLRAIAERYRDWAGEPLNRPFAFVEMSATPGTVPAIRDEEDDRKHPVLGPRLTASKPAELIELKAVTDPEAADRAIVERLCVEAQRYARSGGVRIAVIVNRVATARAVYERLATGDRERLLLTGRARPFERDRLVQRWRSVLENPGAPTTPVFVVATQCIEVGVNFDFDAIVTEAASLDALQQRFGRLNRFGRSVVSPASIVLRPLKKGKVDPVTARRSRIHGNG